MVAQLVADDRTCMQQILILVHSSNADLAGLVLVLVSILGTRARSSPEVLASIDKHAVLVLQAVAHILHHPQQPWERQALAAGILAALCNAPQPDHIVAVIIREQSCIDKLMELVGIGVEGSSSSSSSNGGRGRDVIHGSGSIRRVAVNAAAIHTLQAAAEEALSVVMSCGPGGHQVMMDRMLGDTGRIGSSSGSGSVKLRTVCGTQLDVVHHVHEAAIVMGPHPVMCPPLLRPYLDQVRAFRSDVLVSGLRLLADHHHHHVTH
jgi:hypothetical protein